MPGRDHKSIQEGPPGFGGPNDADISLFLGDDTPHVAPHPTHHVNASVNIPSQNVKVSIDMPAEEVIMAQIQELKEKLNTILARLDLIFGDQVLINGRFVNIKDFNRG